MNQNNTDLEDTLQLPVLDDEYENKGPKRLIFPFVAKLGIALSIVLIAGLGMYEIYDRMFGYRVALISNETLAFTGVDGYGTVQEPFTPEAQAITYLKNRNKNGKLDDLIESISCSFEQSDYLINGMKVVYACRYDAQAARDAGYTIINTSKMYTVEGLQEAQLATPFKGIQTEWIYENGTLSLQITPDETNQMLGFTYEYRILSEKRVLMIAKQNDELMQKYGYYVTSDSLHAYIDIPEQPVFVTSSDSITEEAYDVIHQTIAQSLSQCGWLSFGKEILEIGDFVITSIEFTDDTLLQVTISFHNIYTQQLSEYYSFTASYQGHLQYSSNGYIFILQQKQSCSFDGYGTQYELTQP